MFIFTACTSPSMHLFNNEKTKNVEDVGDKSEVQPVQNQLNEQCKNIRESWNLGTCYLEKLQNGNQRNTTKEGPKPIKIFRKRDRMNGMAEYARNGRKILELRDVVFHSTDVY